MPSILDIIICIMGGGAIILVPIIIIISSLNKKRFIEVCRLYEVEFGFLPFSVATFRSADIVGFNSGYWMKMDFIIHPLIFGRKSGYSKNNDVKFIRQLPLSIRRWFLAEYVCVNCCGISFLIAGICIFWERMF